MLDALLIEVYHKGMAKRKLSDFKPLSRNPNRHSERGLYALEHSMERVGFVAPITAAADGTILDGNLRAEVVADKFPDDPIIVESDGTRPIIHIRTDITGEDDPRAKLAALYANRVGELSWTPDPEVLAALREEDEAGVMAVYRWGELNDIIVNSLTLDSLPDEPTKTSSEPDGQRHMCPKCGYEWIEK